MATSKETTSKIAAPQESPDTSVGKSAMVAPLPPEEPPADLGVKALPPSITVNQPDDVTRSAPPYSVTITGTAEHGHWVLHRVEWRLGTSGPYQLASWWDSEPGI